ncbi:hypothetical protein [Streptomyces phage phiScoe10]|nr:hypothetical protein [Streptomyces phage phiScoe10]
MARASFNHPTASGPTGPTLPPGGTAGQVLTKSGSADGEAAWITPGSGFLVIAKGAAVPADTPNGTLILERTV